MREALIFSAIGISVLSVVISTWQYFSIRKTYRRIEEIQSWADGASPSHPAGSVKVRIKADL